MTTWGTYPKVWNLGHPAVTELFMDHVFIEEKIDGSQFSFAVIDGVLRMRSKGKEILLEAPEKMFNLAVATAISLSGDLHPGWTYRAEYLNKPKHNVLAYDRVPEQNLILFDVETGPEQYLDPHEKLLEGRRLGLEVVPALASGRINSAEELRALLDTTSVLGGQKVEGVVVKNYNRWGRDGHVLLGKFVSEAFKEVHGGEWRKSNPTKSDVLDQLVLRYRTPARFMKAVQHLREAGKLEQSPRDIGLLIKAVKDDVDAECREEIAAILTKWAMPHILRAVAGGLPEWYKEELLKQQFADAPAVTQETE